jgi:hypothetical protein
MNLMDAYLKKNVQIRHARTLFLKPVKAPVAHVISLACARSCKTIRNARCQATSTASAKLDAAQKSKTQQMFELIEERKASGVQGDVLMQAYNLPASEPCQIFTITPLKQCHIRSGI